MCWFIPTIQLKEKEKKRDVCTLVYCVDFYILYDLCSIFKRRFLDLKILNKGNYRGWELTGWGWVETACHGLNPGESASKAPVGV